MIPLALAGKSILARAKNGTGKTGSFCIPCLEKVDTSKPGIQALILVPTRELALQTAAVLKELGKFLVPELEVVSLTGGTSTRDDILRLQGKVHVLVGTPGRIIDLAGRGACDLKTAHFIALVRTCCCTWTCVCLACRTNVPGLSLSLSAITILRLAMCDSAITPSLQDEADKLLAAEFGLLVERLLNEFLPKRRQVLLLSATFPISVRDFKSKYMPDAEVSGAALCRGVDQRFAVEWSGVPSKGASALCTSV